MLSRNKAEDAQPDRYNIFGSYKIQSQLNIAVSDAVSLSKKSVYKYPLIKLSK